MRPNDGVASPAQDGRAPGILTATRTAEVVDRLGEIRDPELDEPVTAMGFIQAIEIVDGKVGVTFQLPTAWCAANFAFLMAVDMKAAVRALPWVTTVEIVLLEHFAARRINEAVGQDLSFVEAFPQKAEAELDRLRHTFVEKAFLARQHAVLESLPNRPGDEPANWTIAELEGLARQSRALAEPVTRYLALRRPLGGTSAFVNARGEAVAPSGWPAHRRDLRRTAMTMAANAEHCRVLASARLA
ncbi:iron-sulfur cluster assembly protein [Kaistia granuli]|uniref:iron-sulfur cluster assembly protein n=1 Tax=Kaistia granuli TaxID=363259 RepID=UPI00037E6FEA|nr:iron-sulfur cluster assembly protein [Kaistia granuli]